MLRDEDRRWCQVNEQIGKHMPTHPSAPRHPQKKSWVGWVEGWVGVGEGLSTWSDRDFTKDWFAVSQGWTNDARTPVPGRGGVSQFLVN